MRRAAALMLAFFAMSAAPALAQEIVYETITEETIVEDVAVPTQGSERFVFTAPAPVPQGIAAFGPFRVLGDDRAALVDATDSASPVQFAAMLRAYPGIATLEMVECPGTEDDRANLKLGRMLHARGIATHVPDGGSVRSGGVELFLAGVHHTAAPRAEFAVHAWADEDGHEPKDYPADAPENRAYLDYYREMGMTPL
ncbi:MAG: hydrolase, alpha/beta fold family protein, partial [Novosphingobium sp.]|nr:hydrolase, alpha/beta fold family protein [Novosphingobium sp.]